jgi:HlyD family secretion protein
MSRGWLGGALAVLLLAAGSYALYRHLEPRPLPPGILYGNGHVEGTEVRVAAEVGGRVLDSALVEGEPVAAGAPLLRIDPADYEIALKQARADLLTLDAEARGIGDELATWRHHLASAERELERYRRLGAQGSVSPQRLEEATDREREARGRVDALEARLAANRARQEAAAARRALAESQLARTEVRAPRAATVLVKAIEPGELAQPGQILAVLVDLTELELTVYLPEAEIGKLRLGAPARVRVDAYPERDFTARIKRIDQRAQFTPREVHMPEERVRMVFGVTLAIANSEGVLKPGMPADAWIRWDPDASWPQTLWIPR